MGRARQARTPAADVIERERRVLELRRAGVSFDVIATQVGYRDRGAAYKAYKRALARTLQQPAAELRDLEVDRLDRLLTAVWPKALRGDLAAVDRVLRVAERRARLLGLDAPVSAVSASTPARDVEVEQVAAEIIALTMPG